MNILNISSIIRNSFTDAKKQENTILFDIDNEFRKSTHNIVFSYLYLHPYSNSLLGNISQKWKQYSALSKRKSFNTSGFHIFTLPVFIFPFKTVFNGLLFRISAIVFQKRIDRVIKACKPTLIQALDVDKSASIAQYISEKYNIPYIVCSREINQKRFKYIDQAINGSSAIISHGYVHSKVVIEEFKDKTKIMIPHGVDDNLFSSSIGPFHNINTIKILSIGRLLKYKNFDLLIKAVSKYENIELDIYGDGIERDNLITIIHNLDIGHRVRLITAPFVNQDLPMVFKRYNLFAMISYPETFGRVYAEAAVSGLPIIGAKYSGLYGQLEEGINAFFVNHKEGIELESLFQYLTNNPQSLEVIRQNNLKIRNKFSWSNILTQYFTLYKSINEKSK